jgi:hypothetical protein
MDVIIVFPVTPGKKLNPGIGGGNTRYLVGRGDG